MKDLPTKLAARLLTALAFAMLLLAPMATAQSGNGNSGDIKVHDEMDADPDTRNEPHVDCDDFWIEGFNMATEGDDLTFYSWPPTGDKSVVLESTWTADDGEPANHFLAGPFTLAAGHYRVEAGNGDNPGGDHVKSKMFWVECEETSGEEPTCEDQPDMPECQPECEVGEPGCAPTCEDQPDMEGCEPAEEPACPTDLSATANQDGSITLTWTAAAGSDGTNVYRAEGDGELEPLAELDAGVETYRDTTTTVGASYSYSVRAVFDGVETQDCPVAETTAIPEFPTVMAVGLASGGSLLAFALANRRKK